MTSEPLSQATRDRDRRAVPAPASRQHNTDGAAGFAQAPPHDDPALSAWRITRYNDARLVLRSPDVLVRQMPEGLAALAAAGIDPTPLSRAAAATPLVQNPPSHEPVRRWFAKVLQALGDDFGPERTAAITDALMDGTESGGAIDAVKGLCDPLPAHLLARALGGPIEPVMRVAELGAELSPMLWHKSLGLRELAEWTRIAEQSQLAAGALVEPLRRRIGPIGEAADLAPESHASALVFLVYATTETTSSILASALALCLTDAVARDAFCKAAADRRAVVEEILRRASSGTVMQARWCRAAVEGPNWTIPAGAKLLIDVGRANHDPDVFPAPLEFRPERAGPPHLLFGAGLHNCLGAAIARRMVESFLDAMLCRRQTRLAGTPRRSGHPWLPRLEELLIVSTARPSASDTEAAR